MQCILLLLVVMMLRILGWRCRIIYGGLGIILVLGFGMGIIRFGLVGRNGVGKIS